MKSIFTSDEQKEKAEFLKAEFNDKLKQLIGPNYCVEIRKIDPPPVKGPDGLQKIYPHFCKTVPYSKELQECIEGTIENLYKPGLTPSEAKKPGLLLGKIQSGKTRAFVGCMALAFDNGIDACIILTKGTNALVDQTVKRMKYDFRDCKRDARPKVFPTVSIYDIMKKRCGIGKSLINNEKNVFIAKKQDENMEALLDVFLNSELKEKNILIIDDEADFVSRAFMRDKGNIDEGRIASQIDKLIEGLPNCRYLQVTATPYSLYLQPDNYVEVSNGKVVPFRPRFTALVPIHDKYIGSQQYFVDSQDPNSMYSCLYHEVHPDCIASLSTDKKATGGHFIKRGVLLKNVENSPKVADLRWSIMHYFVASAIRELQEESLGHDSYHTSYVMHIRIGKEGHAWEADLIEALLLSWAESLTTPSANLKKINALFDEIYENLEKSISLGKVAFSGNTTEKILDIPAKDIVYARVLDLIKNEEYNVQIVNSAQNVQSLLDDSGQLELTHKLNLFVGALVLDRGITIGHLLGFFYGREPQTKQQATVLQHCRMYGNRSLNDMAVTRLYSQKTLYNVLKKVNDMDDMMRARFTATINDPKADPSIEFIVCDKSNGIVPCNLSNVALSKSVIWKAGKFVLPSGQQTITAAKLKNIVDKIGQYFKGKPNRNCFEIDAKDAIAMVKLAQEQFIYSSKYDNLDCKWDGMDMITLIKRLKDSNGKILAYTRTGCNTGRKRSDGKGFIDAPLDGQEESPYLKSQSEQKPILAMQLNKGNKSQGWLGEPFYWPVLCLPKNMDSIMYCPR